MMERFFYSIPAQVITLAVLLLFLAIFKLSAIDEELAIAQNQRERIDSETFTLDRMSLQFNKLEEVAQRYEDNLVEIDYFTKNYLKQKDERVLNISRFLEQLARENRVTMEQVTYPRVSTAAFQGVDVYRMTFPLVGRYRDIRRFISGIEKSDMFLVITQMSVEDEAGQRGSVRVELALTTYFQKEGE